MSSSAGSREGGSSVLQLRVVEVGAVLRGQGQLTAMQVILSTYIPSPRKELPWVGGASALAPADNDTFPWGAALQGSSRMAVL